MELYIYMYVTNGDYHFPYILKDHGLSLFAISHIDMITYMLCDNISVSLSCNYCMATFVPSIYNAANMSNVNVLYPYKK